jgi:hypothetical protein
LSLTAHVGEMSHDFFSCAGRWGGVRCKPTVSGALYVPNRSEFHGHGCRPPARTPAASPDVLAGPTHLVASLVAALESALVRRQEATLALDASLNPDEAPALLESLTSLDVEVTALLALPERFIPPVGAQDTV